MNHRPFFRSSSFALLALAAPLFVPRVARAADPSLDAQVQLGGAFDACEQQNARKYFELRDFAFSVDHSLKGWNGSVQRWKKKTPVQETLARCDKEMAPIAEKAKRQEDARPLYRALEETCLGSYVDDERFEKWKAARAAYVAKAGNDDPDGTRAKCDAEMPKKYGEKKKKDAELAAQIAKNRAEDERARVAAQKRKQIVDAIAASIGGDRKKVFAKLGWPDGAKGTEERIRKAAVWDYSEDIYMGTSHGEEESTEHTARCTSSFQFAGDKLVKAWKSGPGCR